MSTSLLTSAERVVVVAWLERILTGTVTTADGVAAALRGLPDNASRRRVKDAIYGVAVMRLRLAFIARARGHSDQPATLLAILDDDSDDNDDDSDGDDISWPDDPIESVSVRRS